MSVRQLENVEEYVVLERSLIGLLDKYLILVKKCLKVIHCRQYIMFYLYNQDYNEAQRIHVKGKWFTSKHG